MCALLNIVLICWSFTETAEDKKYCDSCRSQALCSISGGSRSSIYLLGQGDLAKPICIADYERAGSCGHCLNLSASLRRRALAQNVSKILQNVQILKLKLIWFFLYLKIVYVKIYHVWNFKADLMVN